MTTPIPFTIHIDEAGRGPLAWPVYVGAVASLRQVDTSGLQDSKKLSSTQRETIYQSLTQRVDSNELVYGSWHASAQEIDKYGIIPALQHAILRAIKNIMIQFRKKHWQDQLQASTYGEDQLAYIQLHTLFQHLHQTTNISLCARLLREILHTPQTSIHYKGLIIDGNHMFDMDKMLTSRVITIIKGDQKNPLISLASIIAKVERDQVMQNISPRLERIYQFSQHKGYGTARHRQSIQKHWASREHRKSFCRSIDTATTEDLSPSWTYVDKAPLRTAHLSLPARMRKQQEKPWLLLHICCAPDLTWPLHWLKNHFTLHLFWYNPNIHPRAEHTKRYEQFLKLVWLEEGDYKILEDRYDPKEFFDAMVEKKDSIHQDLVDADRKTVLQKAGEMEEWSDRCNPCYLMRLEQAAKNAVKHNIPYFTSTLLISPKKKMDKLFKRWVEAENNHPGSKFLWFDFIKNKGYDKASKLTKKHWLRRQNYCGCGRTIPRKPTTHKAK